MHPDTDGPPAADLAQQGEGYARALLDRIGAGVAGPDELAHLMQFLHSGPMLHAACAVLVMALRPVLRPDGQGGADAR